MSKPVFTNNLYAVFKDGSRYVVTLLSNRSSVQYSGLKSFCIEWATENGI